MGEKQKEEPTKQSRVITNSMKFFDSITDEDLTNPNFIPDYVQSVLNPWVRNKKKTFDLLLEQKEKFDKSSDEYISVNSQVEKIAKSFINAKNQINDFKAGIKKWKQDITSMNKGTQDSVYFTGSAIYGNQTDEMHIDPNGFFKFLTGPEDFPNNDAYGIAREVFKANGQWGMPMGGALGLDGVGRVITEPFGMKSHVLRLAEKTQLDKAAGKAFDSQWTYTSTLDKLTQAGPNATIGMAFSDLAGDNQTKSFAEMYEEGMKEEYYTHPDTGEALPEGMLWMKDPANADVVSKLLSKYIANVMNDIHGPVINEDTGLVKTTKSQMAQNLIKKYSHSGHKHK